MKNIRDYMAFLILKRYSIIFVIVLLKVKEDKLCKEHY